MLVRAAELGQQRCQVLRLRNHVRRTNQLLDADLRDAAVAQCEEQVADVQHADDLVEGASVDRVARER